MTTTGVYARYHTYASSFGIGSFMSFWFILLMAFSNPPRRPAGHLPDERIHSEWKLRWRTTLEFARSEKG